MNINTSIIDQRITKIIDGAASRKAAIFEKLFITENEMQAINEQDWQCLPLQAQQEIYDISKILDSETDILKEINKKD